MKNLSISQFALLVGILMMLPGCSHESWTNIEETTRLPSVAAPILAPVNWVAKAGRALTGRSSETPDAERGKQFVLSRRVMDRFSNDGKFSEEVLEIQNRFRSHDWGDISSEQFQANAKRKGGKGTIGRYSTGSNGSALIITDEGSEFKVRYEDEPEE